MTLQEIKEQASKPMSCKTVYAKQSYEREFYPYKNFKIYPQEKHCKIVSPYGTIKYANGLKHSRVVIDNYLKQIGKY